jgi:signal transduction histidine kinase
VGDAAAVSLLSLRLERETDLVVARQRARQLASLLGFEHQDQVRIATAISEIARNTLQYASGGRAEYLFHLDAQPPRLEMRISDNGPGIPQLERILDGRYQSPTGLGLGIMGARRLMDEFEIQSSESGTTVSLSKYLSSTRAAIDCKAFPELTARLTETRPDSALEEICRQNQELLQALEEIRRRQADISQLNLELEETNRGVLALYAELDDRAASLRRADEVKSRFLSHMSHEFRTPLNSILALSRLVLEETDGKLNAEQKKQIGYIRSAAQELFEMVNDLLDLAKVEAGRVDVRMAEVNLSELFGGLRGIMRPVKQNEAVRLVIEDPPDALVLLSDEGKLGQILRNLISNALKFTDRGEVRLSLAIVDGRAVFAVSDTGIGIPPEHQQHIFQEFAQVDNPLQRRVKGTGLGLPLSRKLAELLGGTLTVESQPGVGSTFFLSLPAVERGQAAAAAAGAVSASTAGDRPVLLIVDDDERSRYLVRQLFHGAEYDISEAATASEGLERARFERPALIFLDLDLPDEDGFQVLREMRADPALGSPAVIIHTAAKLGPADLYRLAEKHDAVLPKSVMGTGEAYAIVQKVLVTRNLPGLTGATFHE